MISGIRWWRTTTGFTLFSGSVLCGPDSIIEVLIHVLIVM